MMCLAFFKMSTPNDKTGETVHPQDTPEPEGENGQAGLGGPLAIHPPIDPNQPRNGSKHKTPFWEKAAVVVAFGLLIVNFFQMRATKEAAEPP